MHYVASRNFACSLAILLRSLVNSTAFPQETSHWLAKCCVFLQKLMKLFFPPPHILITKHFLEKLQKYCVVSRSIASLLHAKVLHSPEKLCNALAKILFSQFAPAHKSFALIRKKCCVSPKKLCIRLQNFFSV